MTAWRVQGMGRGKVPADWPPLDAGEVAAVLAHYPSLGGPVEVRWRSPRPMSAAALVAAGSHQVFVKRHHQAVRSGEALVEEHAFGGHLLGQRICVPRVLVTATGTTVVRANPWVYEVHDVAPGVDAYRDVLSWEPYRSTQDARAAGVTLARFHRAAATYSAAERAGGVLSSSDHLLRGAPFSQVVAARPALAAALERWPWREDIEPFVRPALAVARAALDGVVSQWGHGDWHPSNLLWGPGRGQVRAVIDLGLANRTSAVHDLAIALERATVGWLDLEETGTAPVDLVGAAALVAGYVSVRPLSPAEAAALVAVLPVVHVDFALSEVEYFAAVVGSGSNAALAYEGYLLGHARWFARAVEAGRLLEVISATARPPRPGRSPTRG